MTGSKRAPDRDLLLARHTFPGEYLVKAFGPALGPFAGEVEACAVEVVGTRVWVSSRVSSRGNKVCVTLTLHAETVDEVIEVYERLGDVSGLAMVL